MNDVLESLRIAIIAVTTLAIAAGFCILYAWAGVYIAVHYGELPVLGYIVVTVFLGVWATVYASLRY